MKVGYLGVNQYGQKYTMYKHPRKELLEILGATKAEKMYVDKKDGSSVHVGYVIGDEWITVYEVHQWKETR